MSRFRDAEIIYFSNLEVERSQATGDCRADDPQNAESTGRNASSVMFAEEGTPGAIGRALVHPDEQELHL